jgi:microcystin-dependent protein
MPAPSGATSLGYPYPLETDSVDPARDIKALAEFLNTFQPPFLPPVGAEMEWAGKNDPNANWMVEDGREVSRATYAGLFAVIGTEYGAGNGTTTFNIPDTRGKVSIGAGKGAGLTERVRTVTYGEESHTLTLTETVSHSHGTTDPGHAHSLVQSDGVSFASISYVGGGSGGQTGSVEHAGYNNGFIGVSKATTGLTVNAAGGGGAHNNIQPSIAKNKIIRVL